MEIDFTKCANPNCVNAKEWKREDFLFEISKKAYPEKFIICLCNSCYNQSISIVSGSFVNWTQMIDQLENSLKGKV